ncbi:hypothetical protein EV193_101649 [Herbihabitans rhizosphaerae]|uniref:Uncharacterized protein n=1 Tax=Herbihabitans rhizosphaerae TaxID=1872711 RepID=A0A4Q7L7A6_9PSEU|nr:hypothetical protein [Herbihabitans rhizosphaerae]RZS44770.1 hypothetical protein EV193_101649 [Herbihabitans rhizosphaerae]
MGKVVSLIASVLIGMAAAFGVAYGLSSAADPDKDVKVENASVPVPYDAR